MPHQFEQGFSVREPAWHGLAEVLEDYPGREQAMQLAGHAFTVIERPAGHPNRGGLWVANDRFKSLIREDTDELLHIVLSSYGVVQNEQCWDILDALIAEPNVCYETAGVLAGGSLLWAMARIDEPSMIPGDPSPIYPYVAVSWSHNESASVKAQRTSVRIICMNTFQLAAKETARTGRQYVFRHTARVNDRIAEAKEALAGIRREHVEFVALAQELAKIPIPEIGVRRFVDAFIPMPEPATDRMIAGVEKRRKAVRAFLDSPTCEGIRNTAWGLVNAGVEYLDYGRQARSSETKLRRSVLEPERQKEDLVSLARACASVAA